MRWSFFLTSSQCDYIHVFGLFKGTIVYVFCYSYYVSAVLPTHVKISHLVDKMMAEQACSKLLTSCYKLVNLSSCNKLVTICELADL